MIWLGFRMPRRFLRGRKLKLLLTVVALACGVALVCAIDLANRAVQAAFEEIIDTMAGRTALTVSATGGGLLREEVAELIGSVPGVELAVPVVSGTAFATDGSGEVLHVHGVDVANEDAVRVYQPAGSEGPVVEEPLAFLNQPDSIILTDRFAVRKGLEIGDRIVLDTPSGQQTFTIRQLLAAEGVARVQGGNLGLMDVAAAEVAFTRPHFVNRIDVVVERSASPVVVAGRISAVLPANLEVEAPSQRKLDLHAVMRSAQTLLFAVSLLGPIAAFLIAYSRISTVLEARTWEHAVLRALGVRRRRVWWELAKESALIGIAGIGIGVPLGIVLGRALLPVIASATALTAQLLVPATTLSIRPASIVLAVVVGLASILLAAAVPAWRASRVAIAETLGRRGVERSRDARPPRRIPRYALIALTVSMVLAHILTGSRELGLAASALIVVSTAFLSRTLVERVSPWLTHRVKGPAARFAAAGLAVNLRRSALAVATLAVGFGAVVWLWTVARSFEESVVQLLPGKIHGDLSVTSAHSVGYVEAPVHDRLLDQLAEIPGVAKVVGEQTITWTYDGGPISIDSYDPQYFVDSSFGKWQLVGDRMADATGAAARGEGVILSENFTRNLAIHVGDTLTIDTPNGPLTVPVVGVIVDFLSPRGTINMSRDVYKKWWGDDQIVRGLVKAGEGVSPTDVRDRIVQQLGAEFGLRVFTIGELMEWFAQQVRRAFSPLHLLAGLVLLLVLVGISDALAADVLERTRELGIARAIGARRNVLGRALLIEALILGALGLALAVVVGLLLGVMWVKWTFPSLLGWSLFLYMPTTQLLLIGIGALLSCLVASYVPAARATRLEPVEALRWE